MKQKILTLLTGVVLGMALVSGGYAAANTVLTASPSSQTFYVNGKRVEFEASLRDVRALPSADLGAAVLVFAHANRASKTGFACFSRCS